MLFICCWYKPAVCWQGFEVAKKYNQHRIAESLWLVNKLTINAKKSNFVIFRPSQKKLRYQIEIRLYNNASNSYTFLECKDYVKFLGVLIDKNFTWKYHIDYIASKISRVVGIISRLRHSVPLDTLIQIYRPLIFPYTYYGIAAWGHAAQVYLRKVFILQKRALRLMFFAGNRSHAIPLFVSANVLPLNMLYFETVCSLLHDISTILPNRISVIFLLVHLTFILITLDFLMSVIYMLINQDWEFNLIRFPFSELNCGIAWSLNCEDSKIKFIKFYLRYLVMRMIMLMSLS